MIRQLASDYPIQVLCEVLSVPRSTVYYTPQEKAGDAVLLGAIDQIVMRWPFYGYRRVTAQLKRERHTVGERRVRRLLRQINHSASVGRVRVRTTDSEHGEARFANLVKTLDITRPNQVWVADITYIRLGRQFIYLAVMVDAFTRGLRGWQLSHSLEAADLTGGALRMALQRHPAPDIHHSDQGKQYAAASYRALLPATTHVSMSAVGQPTENGLVERFMRTLKEEHLDYSDYRDFDDALAQIAHWLEVEYMTERIHSALDYLTPAEFEAAYVHQPDSPLAPL
jgi:transposase InsO family protein